MIAVSRFVCKVLGHEYIMGVRRSSPAIGREEMRCKRCDDQYLLPWEDPKDKFVTDDDRKKRLGLEN